MQSLRDDWRDYKRDAALLDCDDLLYTARNLLRDHEEEVRRALSQRFRHVMVDEFQDTTELQVEILKVLFGTGRSRFFTVGDTVIVELALQGTHKGPLALPMGTIPPTGKRMDAPCCDVFRLRDGKIESFNCYPSGTVTMAQLGVLGNLQAAMSR